MAVEPIHMGADLFAIIDKIDPTTQTLRIKMVNAAISRDGSNILFPGDLVLGQIDPLKPGNTRQAVCINSIHGRDADGRLIMAMRPAFPREGCLAQLHDYEGAAGLPASDIRVGLPVRIMLNGDLVLDTQRKSSR